MKIEKSGNPGINMKDTPRVLVVDDEIGLRDTMFKRLKKRGLEVSTAGSGEEALDILSRDPFDVIVLDVKMPGIDGIETLKRIKAIQPDYEVIILSGHASLDLARRIVELGGFDYLLKPFDFEDLLVKIEGAFNRKKGFCVI
jgi:DNA-binding NtrC family response regulator